MQDQMRIFGAILDQIGLADLERTRPIFGVHEHGALARQAARGLLEMRGRGYATIAQDEASSVVFGMPMTAIKLGAVDNQGIIALDKIGDALKAFSAQRRLA